MKIKKNTTVNKSTRFTHAEIESHIARKKHLLSQAFKIPPALNQFTTTLDDSDTETLIESLSKFKPESKAAKAKRLKSNNPKSGPKPTLLKFGYNHVVDLIEKKKAKFVVIAADVDPIEIVAFIPTLCKKMNIPYVIVKEKKVLGQLVGLKKTACLALCEGVEKKIESMGMGYLENYEEAMKNWGGGVILSQMKNEVVVEE